MTELFAIADFVRRARRMMRFDDLSRNPLRLLRLEWRNSWAACDWLMRTPDPWDSNLPARLAQERETLQALRDAMSMRNLIFDSFPDLDCAELQMFRAGAGQGLELMMTGSVQRSDEMLPRIASVTMQAKLCGFRFSLTEGVLDILTPASISSS